MNPATMWKVLRLIDSVIFDANQFGWNGREVAEVRPYFRVTGGASDKSLEPRMLVRHPMRGAA